MCFYFIYFSFGCARSALLRGLFSPGKQGLCLAVVCGLLTGVASPSVAHRLRRVRAGAASRCGVWASRRGGFSFCDTQAPARAVLSSFGTGAQWLQLPGSGAQAQ